MARCEHCGQEFKVRCRQQLCRGSVCPACRRARQQWLKKRWRARRRAQRGTRTRRTDPMNAMQWPERLTQAQTARVLGVPLREVILQEASAMAKLRRDPALRAAFREYARDGMPQAAGLVRELVRNPAGEALRRMQELIQLQQRVDALAAQGKPVKRLRADLNQCCRLVRKLLKLED